MRDGRPRFDAAVEGGGYRWWYVDGVSDCGRYALTIIAFVGSVFSPYYWLRGRRDPEDHVAVNACLYAPGANRWAMTERGRQAMVRSPDALAIGASRLSWENGGLAIDLDETALPRPPGQWLARRLRGRIDLTPAQLFSRPYPLDDNARHYWQPVAPIARIRVDIEGGEGLRWEGHGYMDMNWGIEPLEAAFLRWDWARGLLADGSAAILYRPEVPGGGNGGLGLRFAADGTVAELPEAISGDLPASFWRTRRKAWTDPGTKARVLKTLEDSPFYVRSLVESSIGGEPVTMMHESFDGRRFASPLVKAMLPFRMPRRARALARPGSEG